MWDYSFRIRCCFRISMWRAIWPSAWCVKGRAGNAVREFMTPCRRWGWRRSPRAILLDEPFSKLDAARRDEIRHWVFARVRDHRLPTLMVTHDEADARAAGGRILRLTERGTIMGLTDQEERA